MFFGSSRFDHHPTSQHKQIFYPKNITEYYERSFESFALSGLSPFFLAGERRRGEARRNADGKGFTPKKGTLYVILGAAIVLILFRVLTISIVRKIFILTGCGEVLGAKGDERYSNFALEGVAFCNDRVV